MNTLDAPAGNSREGWATHRGEVVFSPSYLFLVLPPFCLCYYLAIVPCMFLPRILKAPQNETFFSMFFPRIQMMDFSNVNPSSKAEHKSVVTRFNEAALLLPLCACQMRPLILQQRDSPITEFNLICPRVQVSHHENAQVATLGKERVRG